MYVSRLNQGVAVRRTVAFVFFFLSMVLAVACTGGDRSGGDSASAPAWYQATRAWFATHGSDLEAMNDAVSDTVTAVLIKDYSVTPSALRGARRTLPDACEEFRRLAGALYDTGLPQEIAPFFNTGVRLYEQAGASCTKALSGPQPNEAVLVQANDTLTQGRQALKNANEAWGKHIGFKRFMDVGLCGDAEGRQLQGRQLVECIQDKEGIDFLRGY